MLTTPDLMAIVILFYLIGITANKDNIKTSLKINNFLIIIVFIFSISCSIKIDEMKMYVTSMSVTNMNTLWFIKMI